MRTLQLSAGPRSPRLARALVTEEMVSAGCPSEVAQDVRWLTSELATNAVLHAQTDFTVSIQISDAAVRVDVQDLDPRLPQLRVPDNVSGRGLHFVQAAAATWGAEPTETGKVVWFEIDR